MNGTRLHGCMTNRDDGGRTEKKMRKRLTAILLVLALPALVSTQEARNTPDIGEILRRHLEALGGSEAVRSVRSVVSTAEIEIIGTGMKGIMKSYSLRPCLSLSEISLGFFTIRQGFDGERSWMVGPNGKLQFSLDEGSRELQVTTCLLESYDYAFRGDGFSLEARGRDTVEGRACHVLELLPEGGAPCRIYLDSSDFLIKRIDTDSRDGAVEQTFDEYRETGGLKFPFRKRTRHAAMDRTIETSVESISINSVIDPAIFLPPQGETKDYRFLDGGFSEEISFDYRHRHIYIQAKLGEGGDELLFLLDSGAGMTVIDSSVASSMGLPLGGTIPGAGAGGMADFQMTRIPGLRVGGIEFDKQAAITYPISRLMKLFGEKGVGGVIGYDFLSRFVTRIDFENRSITFFEPDSFLPPDRTTAVQAPLLHNIFSIEGTIDSGIGGTFLLDTGANNSLLQQSFAESFGLTRGRRTAEISIRGAGGEEKASLCRFESLAIGSHRLDRPVFAIASGGGGIGAFEGINGIIGNDVLERFTVTLDYGKQTVLLERNSRFGEPFFKDRSGVLLSRIDEKGAMIYTVIPSSPAAEAGLRPGDRIVAMDGKDVRSIGGREDVSRLLQAEEGTRIDIDIVRNGKRKTVRLTLKAFI